MTPQCIRIKLPLALLFATISFSSTALAQDCCDPVAWWRAENDFADSAGSSHGSNIGNVTFAPGRSGRAYSFDGFSAIRLSHTAALEFGPSDNVTISAWLQPTSLSTDPDGSWAVSLGYACTPETIGVYVTTQGQAGFLIRDNAGNTSYVVAPSSIVDGMWHHVAGVRDAISHELRIYCDGVLVATSPDTTTGSLINPNSYSIQPDRIGSVSVACATQRFWKGLIDEVRVYRRALPTCEIRTIATMP